MKKRSVRVTFLQKPNLQISECFYLLFVSGQERSNKRINLLSRLDVNYFWDLMTLKPGDKWRNEIYKYIEKSDVFFLFWSSYAKKLKWVKREWKYALDLKGMMKTNRLTLYQW